MTGDPIEDARREGFQDGLNHALDHARDDPGFRAMACVIVEDWLRKLAGPQGGLDVSVRNTGQRFVGLWDEAGQLSRSSSLFDTLDAYERRRTAIVLAGPIDEEEAES